MTTHPVTATPIPRATFASMVTERLRESIVDGTLTPGAQLSEVELANRFGVSRGPVHEALQRLVQEGLLRSGPGHRVFVPVLSVADLRDIYLARGALEASAVEHIVAMSKSDDAADQLDRFVTLMEESESVSDWEAVGRYVLEFHTALVAASGSERLQRMFSTVISETRLGVGVLTAAGSRDDLVQGHRQIASMIRERQTGEALKVLKKHFDDLIIASGGRETDRTVEGRK